MTDWELDALVATKVMGLRLKLGEPWYDLGNGRMVSATYPYFLSGDGMLAVIEKMRERGYFFVLYSGPVGIRCAFASAITCADWMMAGIRKTGTSLDDSPFTTAEPTSRAVCLAALKALGVEVPE